MTTLPQFRDQIVDHFNLEELKDLCFDLNISYDNLPGDNLSSKARELVNLCNRHGRLPLLVNQCQRLRPKFRGRFPLLTLIRQVRLLFQLF